MLWNLKKAQSTRVITSFVILELSSGSSVAEVSRIAEGMGGKGVGIWSSEAGGIVLSYEFQSETDSGAFLSNVSSMEDFVDGFESNENPSFRQPQQLPQPIPTIENKISPSGSKPSLWRKRP